MKLQMKLADLKQVCKQLNPIVGKAQEIQAMNDVVITVLSKSVEFKAQNMDTMVSIVVTDDINVTDTGIVYISFSKLKKVVAKQNGMVVVIESKDEDKVILKDLFASGYYNLAVDELMPVAFPDFAILRDKINVKSSVFQEIVKSITSITSNGNSYYSGTCFKHYIAVGDEVTVSATDGRVAKQISLNYDEIEPFMAGLFNELMIKREAMDIAASMIRPETKEIEIYFDTDINKCCIQVGKSKVMSSLIEGKFPDIDQLFNPRTILSTVCVNSDDLLDVLGKALAIRPTADVPGILLLFKRDELVITMANTEANDFFTHSIRYAEQSDFSSHVSEKDASDNLVCCKVNCDFLIDAVHYDLKRYPKTYISVPFVPVFDSSIGFVQIYPELAEKRRGLVVPLRNEAVVRRDNQEVMHEAMAEAVKQVNAGLLDDEYGTATATLNGEELRFDDVQKELEIPKNKKGKNKE